jgi:membrane carboxypeptidase/penicillin-binding protein
MVSVALRISDEVKSLFDKLPWVNWSEIAREEMIKKEQREEALEEALHIVSSSQFTEADADLMSDKVKRSMQKS